MIEGGDKNFNKIAIINMFHVFKKIEKSVIIKNRLIEANKSHMCDI